MIYIFCYHQWSWFCCFKFPRFLPKKVCYQKFFLQSWQLRMDQPKKKYWKRIVLHASLSSPGNKKEGDAVFSGFFKISLKFCPRTSQNVPKSTWNKMISAFLFIKLGEIRQKNFRITLLHQSQFLLVSFRKENCYCWKKLRHNSLKLLMYFFLKDLY